MRLSRAWVSAVALTAVGSVPLQASAKDCPPGGWFCEDQQQPAQPPPPPPAPPAQAAPPPEQVEQLPPPPPPSQGGTVYRPYPGDAPAGRTVVVYAPRRTVGYRYQAPRPAPKRKYIRRSEFGLNLRAQGAFFGARDGVEGRDDTGLWGAGMSLRYRPVPRFALDFGVDVLGGRDFQGFERVEVPLSMSGILYFNPRSRVQVFMQGGIHASWAQVRSDAPARQLTYIGDEDRYGADYSYFGGHGGFGLEFRVSKRIGIQMDALAFLRGRTDDGPRPEFIETAADGRMRATNSSAGVLGRLGLNIWW
jgi:hypothetical protein